MLANQTMRWVGHVAGVGEKRNTWKDLVRKAEGRRQLARPVHRWVDNTKMDQYIIQKQPFKTIQTQQ